MPVPCECAGPFCRKRKETAVQAQKGFGKIGVSGVQPKTSRFWFKVSSSLRKGSMRGCHGSAMAPPSPKEATEPHGTHERIC